ncbi:uncharacterized protein NPIL_650401, partial [Nephila pilipes]
MVKEVVYYLKLAHSTISVISKDRIKNERIGEIKSTEFKAIIKRHRKDIIQEICEDSGNRRGLCVNLVLQCIYCGQATSAMPSDMTNRNIRLAYGMRCLGKVNSASKTSCAIMNLPPPPAKFERYNDVLLRSLIRVRNDSMRNAVEETDKNNNSYRDITAAFDGSWQKSGHTSLNGVVSATCLETGKVLGFECLSKYCFKCKNRSNKDHTCEKHFEGFSGGMESDGIIKIFQRSERLCNV